MKAITRYPKRHIIISISTLLNRKTSYFKQDNENQSSRHQSSLKIKVLITSPIIELVKFRPQSFDILEVYCILQTEED
jgi:hypothetical protein